MNSLAWPRDGKPLVRKHRHVVHTGVTKYHWRRQGHPSPSKAASHRRRHPVHCQPALHPVIPRAEWRVVGREVERAVNIPPASVLHPSLPPAGSHASSPIRRYACLGSRSLPGPRDHGQQRWGDGEAPAFASKPVNRTQRLSQNASFPPRPSVYQGKSRALMFQPTISAPLRRFHDVHTKVFHTGRRRR